jgi:hypothetical protein
VLAYATRYMPLVMEIWIQNFKFELIAPTAVLNRNARLAFDAVPSKNGDFSNAAPPARSLAQTGERPKAMP